MFSVFQIIFFSLIFSCAIRAKPTTITHNNGNSTQDSISRDLQRPDTVSFENQNETLIVKSSNEDHSHGVTILRLRAQCSPAVGLVVTVEFSAPFNGIIYSDKQFSNPKCRFLEANSGKQTFTFSVPIDECGIVHEVSAKTIQNTLIFQMDEIVQEKWDVAKRISCEYSSELETKLKQRKTVYFKPLSIGMLDVMDHTFKDDFNGLSCSMEIQKGIFPNMSPIGNDGEVETGDALSILISLKDNEKQYDMSVKDCWALDSENFDDERASKMQLTGLFDGCVITSKLMSKWSTVHMNDIDVVGGRGRSLMAYANLTAFKFPTSNRVHLSCNIEVCKGKCEEDYCKPNESDLISLQSHPTHSPPSSSGH